MGAADPGPEPHAGLVTAAGLVVIGLSAILTALLEIMFLAQWYIGATIVPLMILAAIASNVAIPALAWQLAGARAAIVPVALWLLVILVLTGYTRPEGDAFVLSILQQQPAFYGLLLAGAVAGFGTVVFAMGRDRPQPPALRSGTRVSR